jgi:type IV pilus assembly protein PilQ
VAATIAAVTMLAALAGSTPGLSAAAAPARLLSVSARGPAVVIEATDPVAYTVNRPDPLTLLVDLRNVTFADAATQVQPKGLVAALGVENAAAPDGLAVARVRISLARAAEYTVKSTRSTIRVELAPAKASAAAAAKPAPAATPTRPPVAAPATTSARAKPAAPKSPAAPARRTPAPAVPVEAPRTPAPAAAAEETLTLEEALANGAPLAPTDAPVIDAMTALATAPRTEARPPAAASPAPAAAPAAVRRTQTTTTAQRSPQAAQAPQPEPQAPPQPPPASPVLQGPQSQQISVGQEKKYVGHPISMDFQGVDLRSVLRTFAEISGLNMVIDPDVQGTVDIVLTDVPWDQALEVILRGNALDYTVDGSIVRIARMDTLRKEQDARTQLQLSAANAGALSVRTYTLSYAKAEQAAPLVQRAVLSPRGNVQIDARTNTLIITDLPARLDTVSQLLTTLDRAEPQVEIEARIITTTREFARALGVQWGFNGRVTPDVGNTTGLAFPNNGSLGGRTGGLQGALGNDPRAGDNDLAGTAVNLGVPAATSAIGLAMGSINGAFNLDVALSALERTGKGRILSTPRVTTQNNVEAEITQGVQIPVQTEANNTVTVTFKDAALTLKVTPQITAANTVIMQITLENASPGQLVDTGTAQIPSIDTQRAITKVQVSDGMTTVMGGIFVSREQTSQDRTPVLHRIPFLGWLFKRDSQIDESRELLIFITPRIQKG